MTRFQFLGEIFSNMHGSKEEERRKQEDTVQFKLSTAGSGHRDSESKRAAFRGSKL